MTQQTLAIIDYGSGNLRSAAKAFEHVIATENFPFDVKITSNAADIEAADRIVLPGQGAFGDCMSGLKSVEGMVSALEKAVLEDKKPFLGICVGMQLLADKGYEHGEHEGLGWIPGKVVPIEPNESSLKIPHMGWNTMEYTAENDENSQNFAIFLKESNKKNDPYFYFVHSFMFESKEKAYVLGRTDYGGNVTALIGRANIIGAQFHPEKSQEDGLALLSAFLRWTPNC